MFRSLPFVLAALSILHGDLAWSQLAPQPSSSQNKAAYTVSGTVLNGATGEPMRRALVHIMGPSSAAAFTDESGRFRIDNVPEGKAWVRAERPGFFSETGSPNGPPSMRNFITIGSDSKDIQLRLMPEGRIEGRVMNSAGEPLEGIQVQALGERIVGGRKQFTSFGMASTTGSGHYLIGGLAPGHYYVHTLLHPVFGDQRFRQMGARTYPLAYPSQYFPEAADLASAQSQEVSAGGDAQADFTLTAKPTFRVSGTVAGVQNFVSVFLGAPGVGQPAHVQFDRRTNHFTVNLLPPGAWTLYFVTQSTDGIQYSATQDVTITDSDVNDLQVGLQPNTFIPVHIDQGTSGAPAANVQVNLVPKGPAAQGRWFSRVQWNRNSPGEGGIRNVPPGAYHVLAQMFGSACIESVTSGNTNLLQEDLVVNVGAPSAPINVVLGNNCGKILGTVRSNGQAVPASVLLVSDSATGEPIVTNAQSDGTFTQNSLPPGSYRLYAFSSLENLEYANPDALRSYSGQEVSVSPGQSVTVNLDLLERKD